MRPDLEEQERAARAEYERHRDHGKQLADFEPSLAEGAFTRRMEELVLAVGNDVRLAAGVAAIDHQVEAEGLAPSRLQALAMAEASQAQALRDIVPLRAAIGKTFAEVVVSAEGGLDAKLRPEILAHLDVDRGRGRARAAATRRATTQPGWWRSLASVEMPSPTLLAVPNASEGRDLGVIEAIGGAFSGAPPARNAPARGSGAGGSPTGRGAASGFPSGAVRLLDVHSDPDHDRSVFTLVGEPSGLADALVAGAEIAVGRIDVMALDSRHPSEVGQHPHVGALDVVPVVYLDAGSRGAACAEALVVADRIGHELDVPVFLYGELTASEHGAAVTRSELRRGGVAGLAERIAGGRAPDFGPPRMHRRAGATLVAARPPLVAFNLQLAAPATIEDARRIAALVREGGAEGLPGVRAIGMAVAAGAQVSMNIERPLDVPLAAVIEAVRGHAALSSAELVGLAPRAALAGFPEDVPLPGFDPTRHVIENALGF